MSANKGEKVYASQDEPWHFEESVPPSKDCLRRVRSDYNNFLKESLQGIYCVPDEVIITKYHALIVGPFDTPYEGGFFLFTLYFPANYPYEPPFIKHQTTGGGQVRFNPNLYRNGKVCLSILGTRGGKNEWSPAQTICSILLSIQSILNEEPYYNIDVESPSAEVSRQYNDYVRHEVLRIAVIDIIMNNSQMSIDTIPIQLHQICESLFPSFFESYELTCEECSHKEGHPLMYCKNGGRYRYKSILTNLLKINETLENGGSFLRTLTSSTTSYSSSSSSSSYSSSSSSSSYSSTFVSTPSSSSTSNSNNKTSSGSNSNNNSNNNSSISSSSSYSNNNSSSNSSSNTLDIHDTDEDLSHTQSFKKFPICIHTDQQQAPTSSAASSVTSTTALTGQVHRMTVDPESSSDKIGLKKSKSEKSFDVLASTAVVDNCDNDNNDDNDGKVNVKGSADSITET